MYSYIGSWVKPARFNTPYSNVNLRDVKLKDIFTKYTDGYLILSNPSLTRPVYLDLIQMRRDEVPVNLNMTLRAWLSSIGNLTLNASSVEPTYSTEQVLSRDAILADFDVALCEPNKSPDSDASVGNKTNLYVKYDLGNNTALQTRVLTTVNGFLHPNRPFSNGIQVLDGGRSMLHAHSNNVGLLSFERIGDIQQIPILAHNIHRYSPSTPLHTTVILDLDVSLTGKSLILSLGGYMFVSPAFVTVVSDDTGLIEVNLSKLDIALKLLQSFKYIDLSSLGIFEADVDEASFGKLRLSDVISDVAIKKWLTLPQSFVIVVDTPTLTVEKIPTQATGIYASFETHQNPFLPLVDHYGRLQEYWVKRQNDAWIIQINNPIYKPYLYNTANSNDIVFVNETMAHKAWYLQPPSLLNIVSTRRT